MMWKFTEWTGSNPPLFVKIKNGELKNLKSSPILDKSSPSVLNFYKVSSLSECEKSEKFSSTLSEPLLYFPSTPSELVVLDYLSISSLSVLIQNYMKNRKEGTKRELIL